MEQLSPLLIFFFFFFSCHWGGAVVSAADQSQNQVAHHPGREQRKRVFLKVETEKKGGVNGLLKILRVSL